jgi:PEP-CTERM motif
MKQYQAFSKRFLLLLTPWIATSVLAASPSQAASLALSEGALEFTRFSQSPLETVTDTDTNTIAIENDGRANASANAAATFIVAPATASNSSLSRAFGEGINFLGLGESEATVIGSFGVDAGTPFSFDFRADLTVATSIDNPQAENARAVGDITLALVDTASNTTIDFFTLTGNLTTLGDDDFIAYQKSDNIALSNPVTTSEFGENQEFATASIQGSLQRSFTNNTNLTLIEVKRNQARVTSVPEPSTCLALLFSCGVIGVASKSRRKEKTSACSLSGKVAAEV